MVPNMTKPYASLQVLVNFEPIISPNILWPFDCIPRHFHFRFFTRFIALQFEADFMQFYFCILFRKLYTDPLF